MNDHDTFARPIGTPIYEFRGADTKWQRLTENERELAIALERIEADDLGIHLYNAHVLKRRLARARHRDRPKQHMSKASWIAPEVTDWRPPSLWTAWPLEPELVPTEQERFDRHVGGQDNAQTNVTRTPNVNKSTAELEDVLLGEILRAARSRFVERPWDDPASLASKANDSAQPSRGRKREHETASESSSNPALRPVVLADDEIASVISAPTVRHMLSQLDRLLIGLHKSRKNHCDKYTSKQKIRVAAGDSRSSMPSTSNVRNGAESATAQLGERQSRLNPRDWSEVLGIASLAGWDASIIKRANARCEELFDEHMYFQTLDDSNLQFREAGVVEEARHSERNEDVHSNSPILQPKLFPRPGDLACPYPQCIWHKEKFAQRWRLNAHMRRVHGHGNASRETISEGPNRTHEPREAEEMHGGAHVDGFMRPILARAGWRDRSRTMPKGKRRATCTERQSVGPPHDDNTQ